MKKEGGGRPREERHGNINYNGGANIYGMDDRLDGGLDFIRKEEGEK